MVKHRIILILLILLTLFLAACGQETPRPTNIPLPSVPTPTPTLVSFVVASPTATLPAVTVVPKPTETPIPTATVPPTPTYRPSPTVPGQLPVLPAYASNKPDDAAKAAAAWLNSQPDAKPSKEVKNLEIARDRLKTLLLGWKAIGQDTPVEYADLDGDGQAELVAAFVDNWRGQNATINDYGSVMVLFASRGNWTASPALRSTGLKADAKEEFIHPVLLKVADLNKDNKAEIVFSEYGCGANTCTTVVHAVNWQASKWTDLTPGAIIMPSAEVFFENNNDGTSAIVLFGGSFGSVGAGLQRLRTEYYRWDKPTNNFKLADIRYETSPFLYFRIIDGNSASEKGNYTDAVKFYTDAISTTTLKLWTVERGANPEAINLEKLSLIAFARFRMAVTYALQNQPDKAMALLQEATAKDGVYSGWAQSFNSVYSVSKSNIVKEACTAVTKFTEQNPKLLEPLNQFGYANPTFEPKHICPFVN